jgi:hypothetical protein
MNINNHYDISKYIYNIIKDKFKYEDKWFYLNEKLQWIDDINEIKLKTEIMTTVVNDIIKKSIDSIYDDYKSRILIALSIKLKDTNYIKLIISELKQFY